MLGKSLGWLPIALGISFGFCGLGSKNYKEFIGFSQNAKTASELGGAHWDDAAEKLAASYHMYAGEVLRIVHIAAALFIGIILAQVLSDALSAATKKRVSKPS